MKHAICGGELKVMGELSSTMYSTKCEKCGEPMAVSKDQMEKAPVLRPQLMEDMGRNRVLAWGDDPDDRYIVPS